MSALPEDRSWRCRRSVIDQLGLRLIERLVVTYPSTQVIVHKWCHNDLPKVAPVKS